MDTPNASENPREPDLFLKDGRIRAVLRRPANGLVFRSDVSIDHDADPQATGSCLTARAGPTEIKAIRSLVAVSRGFEDLGRDPRSERVLSFALSHGWLGHPCSLWLTRSTAEMRVATLGGLQGEPLGFWEREARRFARLRGLWDGVTELGLAQREDRNGASARRQIGEAVRLTASGWETAALLDGRDEEDRAGWERLVEPAISRLLPRGQLLPVAQYVLDREVNQSLHGHIDVTLMPFRHNAMRLVPDCLLAALYVQFANEISSGLRNPSLHQCPVCGRSFQGRKNQVYCSPQCKERKKYLVSIGRWEGSE